MTMFKFGRKDKENIPVIGFFDDVNEKVVSI
jgi:hypothetical protein